MFVRLALRNVQRQIRNYLIYFVTVAFSIALLFAVNNLSYSDRIRVLSELSSDIRSMFTMVTVLATIVTALVLSYVTGFMLKLRKREFGMYLTLGMTRRNSQNLFAGETGLLSGLALIVDMGTGDLPAPGGPVCRHLGDPLLCVRLFRSEDSADHRHQCRTVPAVLTGIPSVSEKSHRFRAAEGGGRGKKREAPARHEKRRAGVCFFLKTVQRLILPGGGPGPVPSQRKEERRYPYERDSSHPCRAVRAGLPLQS